MRKNPNAQDYKRKMDDLLNETEKLKQIVITRLYTLACLHPEAPISTNSVDVFKAKSLIGSNRSKEYIKSLEFEKQIEYIQTIEKYVEDQHPHKQLEIKYDKQDPICNCDGRDMPTYVEEGKRWCPQCGYEVK
jgi:hypothetical protein